MVSVIAIASLLVVAAGVSALVARRRRGGFRGIDHASVSRQWLMQHQADDRS